MAAAVVASGGYCREACEYVWDWARMSSALLEWKRTGMSRALLELQPISLILREGLHDLTLLNGAEAHLGSGSDTDDQTSRSETDDEAIPIDDGTEISVDRNEFDFSTLPFDLMMAILSLHSFQFVARAAVLSRAFLSVWRAYPNLSFDLGNPPTSSSVQSVTDTLSRHVGSISSLQIMGELEANDLDQLETWLDMVVSKQTIDSTLKLGFPQALPMNVFSFRDVANLELSNFRITTPTVVEFPRVKKLVLKNCEFPEKDKNGMQLLITGSPACEVMDIVNPVLDEVHDSVEINPRALRSVFIKIKNTPNRIWKITSAPTTLKMEGYFCLSLLQLEQAKLVTNLSISAMSIPEIIPFVFENLASLELDLTFDNDTVGCIFNIIQCAPKLKLLVLECNDGDQGTELEDFWNEQKNRIPMGLKTVEMKSFLGTSRNYDLMNCFLCAQNLQELTVWFDNWDSYRNNTAVRFVEQLQQKFPGTKIKMEFPAEFPREENSSSD